MVSVGFAEAMVCKGLTNMVLLKRTRRGYKIISKTLDVPWNTMKAIINRWKKIGHHSNYKEQDVSLKLTKGEDMNISERLTNDLQ